MIEKIVASGDTATMTRWGVLATNTYTVRKWSATLIPPRGSWKHSSIRMSYVVETYHFPSGDRGPTSGEQDETTDRFGQGNGGDVTFFVIERDGAIIFDSRTYVPCDMAEWTRMREEKRRELATEPPPPPSAPAIKETTQAA
jgi:hypothetical protein